MQTKLTLRLDQDLIHRAKAFARTSGKSVSQLVADFFSLLEEDRPGISITPTVRSLKGMLRGHQVDEEDYRRHLEEKYL